MGLASITVASHSHHIHHAAVCYVVIALIRQMSLLICAVSDLSDSFWSLLIRASHPKDLTTSCKELVQGLLNCNQLLLYAFAHLYPTQSQDLGAALRNILRR